MIKDANRVGGSGGQRCRTISMIHIRHCFIIIFSSSFQVLLWVYHYSDSIIHMRLMQRTIDPHNSIYFLITTHTRLSHPLTCTQHFTFSLSSFKLRYFFFVFSCFMFTALPIMRWWKFAFNNYLFVYIIISFFHCTIFTILFNCVSVRFSPSLNRIYLSCSLQFFFQQQTKKYFFYLLSIFFSFFHRSYISSELFLCDFQLRNLATSKPFPVSATFHLLLFFCTSLAFTHYCLSTMLHCYPCKSYARLLRLN